MSYYIQQDDSFGESVYNLIEQSKEVRRRGKLHKSKHNPLTAPTATTFGLGNTGRPGIANLAGDTEHIDNNGGHNIRQTGSQFGRSVRLGVRTDKFLQRGTGLGGTSILTGTSQLPKPKKFKYTNGHLKKPAVPKRNEKPIMGLTTKKNFVHTNAVENILSVSKKVPTGGPKYVTKHEFGKVPSYLKKIKQEINDEYTYIQELQNQTQTKRGQEMILLPEEERLKILGALKQKWQEVNQKYQSLSFSVPTGKSSQPMLDKTKVVKKEALENALDQLEKDVAQFSKKRVFINAQDLPY